MIKGMIKRSDSTSNHHSW